MKSPSTAVDSRTSQQYATRIAASFFRPIETRAVHLAAWSRTNVPEAARPPSWDETELYDIHGKLLFRDQVMALQDGTELRARTAADQRLGAPVWSLALGAPLDVPAMRAAAAKAAKAKRLTPVPGKRSLICYSYPKLGLLCRNKAGAKVVVDLGDYSLIPFDAAEGADFAETLFAWSPYDWVQPGRLPMLRERWSATSSLAKPLPRRPEAFEAAIAAAAPTVKQKTLALNLHGQKTNVWCAVATAQMILEFHGFQATQQKIANAMGTGPTGTTNDAQVIGYQQVSHGKLSATIDTTASFSEACREIDAQHPCKSGINGHARACAGYKIEDQTSHWLYIFDPWPPQRGQVYWENWASVFHTNYIYVRPR